MSKLVFKYLISFPVKQVSVASKDKVTLAKQQIPSTALPGWLSRVGPSLNRENSVL